MKLVRRTETPKTVTFQSDYSKEEIYQKIQVLISTSKSIDPFYFLKYPFYLFRYINYSRTRIREDYVYITRSVTTPPILVYFETTAEGIHTLILKVSYLPVFRWAFYVSIPLILYFMYRVIQVDHSNKVILLAIGFSLLIWFFIASLAFVHEKLANYFFKRSVDMIIRDLSDDKA
jgi:hypothetical protein